MSLNVSMPIRIFAIVLVLAGLGGMLALRTMGPSDAIEPVVLTPKPATAAKPSGKTPAAPKPLAAAAPAKPAPKPKPKPPASGLPVAIDAALAKHKVVVVSLYVPGARVDRVATAEAKAGAALGGAGFVAVNVLNDAEAGALVEKLGVLDDPSVLVFKRPSEVAVTLPGFADRETVAQAAANAAS